MVPGQELRVLGEVMNDDEELDESVRKALGWPVLPQLKLEPEPEEPEPDWSSQQRVALERIREWLARPYSLQIFRLFGYAGTGKTTLAKYIARGCSVAFATYTGKAAAVMRRYGCTDATTIDNLIYTPIMSHDCIKIECNPPCDKHPFCANYRGRWADREFKDSKYLPKVGLIIIDECSMVNYEMAKDLLSLGIKILVLGDPAQLPPIYGRGYFTECEPDFMLTEIHRQESGSPIIKLATHVRQGGTLGHGRLGNCLIRDVQALSRTTNMEKFDQILCGTHAIRCSLNKSMRLAKGYKGVVPMEGEKVVCLKNDHRLSIYNGTIWNVLGISKIDVPKEGFVILEIVEEGTMWPIHQVVAPVAGFLIPKDGRDLPGLPFAFGYALTVHRAQGSQWPSIWLFDDSGRMEYGAEKEGETFDTSRWLYTAITRASERIVIGQER
jgi:AAA domain/UvrD-like helicase C-terminal domain